MFTWIIVTRVRFRTRPVATRSVVRPVVEANRGTDRGKKIRSRTIVLGCQTRATSAAAQNRLCGKRPFAIDACDRVCERACVRVRTRCAR
jgi:hypothetical protein